MHGTKNSQKPYYIELFPPLASCLLQDCLALRAIARSAIARQWFLTRLPGIPHPLVGGAGEASQSIGLTTNPFCIKLGV
jgi:hypothetical protein